ncbi:hypothetical protein BJ944DRAFT_276285 [Cunninghamella echinulata]|nr:hypothetical protein BJ944DRAFT_276285 [Cunninghamella echinulata]
MLFWSKFLTIAYGVSLSVHYFLPLYFFHSLHFTYYQIAILLCIVLTTRTIGYGFWSAWVDQRATNLHGVLISLLTSLGAASLVLILSIPPDTWLSWPAAILCMILDGWFFQPLGSLIDGVIIKILGDYKLFYESERRWGKLSLGITALSIGCFLDDDHDFDTLMGTVLIGCVALFLLSLSTTVQPADPLLLGFKLEEQSMETSPLLYHHNHHSIQHSIPINYYDHDYISSNFTSPTIHYVTAPLLDSTTYHYKPYSLFGDHLSRISEEDASMLQKLSMASSPSPSRAPSIHSSTSTSLDYLLDNSTFHYTPLLPPSLSSSPLSISPHIHHQHTYHHPNYLSSSPSLPYISPTSPSSSSSPNHSPTTTQSSSLFDTTFMSMSLALLPFPPSDIPMVYLITIFPRFRPHFFIPLQDQIHTTLTTTASFPFLFIFSSCFLLGMASASMLFFSPLIYRDYFELSMHTVGFMILIGTLSDILISTYISKVKYSIYTYMNMYMYMYIRE